MRGFRRNIRGLSEIVGTLMLVLIVVSAATALSLFVSQYQKQVQQRQAISQQKSLESISVLRVTPSLNASANLTRYAFLNFTVASLYINPVTVTQINLNDNPLKQYNAWRLDLTSGTYQWVTIGAGGQLALGPREQVNLLVDLRNATSFSFYNGSFVLPSTSYLKIEVITAFQNDFSRVFIPPTAIGIVTTLETMNGGGGFSPVTVLDGSHSFQPGNASLVAWSWNVTPDNVTLNGEKAVVGFNPAFTHHHILLAVTNSDGLLATELFRFP
jgi:flagellin-like protein